MQNKANEQTTIKTRHSDAQKVNLLAPWWNIDLCLIILSHFIIIIQIIFVMSLCIIETLRGVKLVGRSEVQELLFNFTKY